MQAWLQHSNHPAWTCCHGTGSKPGSIRCNVVLQAALQATQQATDGPRRKTDPDSRVENGTGSGLLLPKYCEAVYKSLRRPTRTINVSSLGPCCGQGRLCGSCHAASPSCYMVALLQLARAALMALWQLACGKTALLLWLLGIDLLLMGTSMVCEFLSTEPLVLISFFEETHAPAFCGSPATSSAQQGRPLLRGVQHTRACLCRVPGAQQQTLSGHASFSLACTCIQLVTLC